MKNLALALFALLSAGCSEMQPSPVAPSAVSPAGPSTTILPVVLPTPVPVPIPSPPPPSETPTPPAPLVLVMGAASIDRTATSDEWRFSVTSGDTLSNFVWSFGDGAGVAGSRTEQHAYKKQSETTVNYTVRVTADSSAHGQVTATRDIVVMFN